MVSYVCYIYVSKFQKAAKHSHQRLIRCTVVDQFATSPFLIVLEGDEKVSIFRAQYEYIVKLKA